MTASVKTIEGIERDAYRSRWRDGLLDLFGGIWVLGVGVSWWLNLFWLPAVFVPLLIVLWLPVRRRVVEPRIGRVTFGRERREREAGGLRGAVWLGLGALVLVAAVAWFARGPGSGTVREWGSAIPAGLLMAMALIGAAMTGVGRFAGYGIVLGLVGVAGVLLGLEPAPQILIGGAIITAAGLARVVRFVAARPVREEGTVG